ncbi:MAG: MaoC family dehydratase N-terminal domain-containing protein [Solirubrobacterales bacterium]|nr:MaoC family dehydratase N-terminal domain-containing protein [Solirubrobacterales bacterium]
MADTLSQDFDALELGGRFRSPGRTITETDLVSFSALTGDHHPLHTDVEWAAQSEFNGRIAHGMLLLSYCVGLVPLDPAQVLALRGFERVAFKRPVRIGDTIHVEGELEAKKELDAATGLVLFAWKIVNQRSEVVTLAKVKVLWRRALPAPAPSTGAVPEQVYL